MDATTKKRIEAEIKEVIAEEDRLGLNPETGEPHRHGEYPIEPPAFDFIRKNREQAREERIFRDYIEDKYRE